jgi:hypothetical protein
MTTTSPKQQSADCHARRAGFSLSKIHKLKKIDLWFLVQVKAIVDFEEAFCAA